MSNSITNNFNELLNENEPKEKQIKKKQQSKPKKEKKVNKQNKEKKEIKVVEKTKEKSDLKEVKENKQKEISISQLQQQVQNKLRYMKRLNIVLENHQNIMLKRQKIIDTISLKSNDDFLSNISLSISELIGNMNNFFNDTTIRSYKSIVNRYENELNEIISSQQ